MSHRNYQRDYDILSMRSEGQTLKDISLKFGVTTERIRQLYYRCVRSLRHAVVYRGLCRDTEVNVRINDDPLDAMILGVAEINCIECNGTGDWDSFMPEPTGHKNACVECKGTGHVLVSI